MYKKAELYPIEGYFLLRCGVYINYNDIIDNDDIIGFCLGKGKIMSVNPSEISLPWSLEYYKVPGIDLYSISHPTFGNMPGKYVTNHVLDYCKMNSIDLQKYFPAFSYCKSYSPGYRDGEWYLPSSKELSYIARCNNDIFMRLYDLTSNRGIDLLNIEVWSSTQFSPKLSYSKKINYEERRYKNQCFKVIPFLDVHEL